MPLPIEDYALIGDCVTTALVGKDGSIDWLCFPRIDSPACFAALLGDEENGRWKIAPAGEVRRVERRYRDGTLVLETDFVTDEGEVRIVDCMPPRSDTPDLVRLVEGRRGSVPVQMELVIRFDYGSIIPWVRRTDDGIRASAGPDKMYCRSDVELHGVDRRTVAEFTVSEGERATFHLTWCHTHQPRPEHGDPVRIVQETEEWWQLWSGRCTYEGPHQEAVLRSLITLKALTFAQTGGLAAAATTSLPEKLGGERNWDYRYCWLRDATFTLYALINNGYLEEAEAWRKWLVNAVAGTPEKLQIMYGVAGERRLTELALEWLPGYEDSIPVRVGNAAHRQHQLDVYGEIMDALHLARRKGLDPDENAWRVQRSMMKFLESDWQRPDEGIWEVRGPRRHFTHSKIMAWVAVDRAVKAVESFNLPGDAAKWRTLRTEIHDQVCREGFSTKLNSFVQSYGATDADASLLMIPLVGFLPATDPRMLGTVEYIRKKLTRGDFLDRYLTRPDLDGLERGEGAFLLCSFWLADNLALQNRWDEAREIFEQLLDLRNDVGLLSEQYQPELGRMVGNFPQAFSHVGLINTASNLTRTKGPAEDRRQQSPEA